DFTYPPLLIWNFFMRVGFFFIVTLLIVEIKRLLSHEQHLARTDFLTGALNRLAFYDQATVEIERSARFDHGLSLVYIDVDDFKLINDKYGHDAGDLLLKEVASTIAANIRGIDTMARLGGDEFVVLLPQTDESSANIMVVRLQQALLANMATKAWPATFSIGVVTSPLAPYSVDELIKIADGLMYRAKNNGKNTIVQEVSGITA
ncbi:MAG TPA: GGDEF domain-containing protein, partial [Rhodocyclaceae bacterium]|nr:GGDEF domain-containing protein [Rhodocyclaceae bacterium]